MIECVDSRGIGRHDLGISADHDQLAFHVAQPFSIRLIVHRQVSRLHALPREIEVDERDGCDVCRPRILNILFDLRDGGWFAMLRHDDERYGDIGYGEYTGRGARGETRTSRKPGQSDAYRDGREGDERQDVAAFVDDVLGNEDPECVGEDRNEDERRAGGRFRRG